MRDLKFRELETIHMLLVHSTEVTHCPIDTPFLLICGTKVHKASTTVSWTALLARRIWAQVIQYLALLISPACNKLWLLINWQRHSWQPYPRAC